jgi:L-seryl-tRNA(Ser) seleniumtransferase
MAANPFRAMPAVNDVLQKPAVQALAGTHAHDAVVDAVRQELTDLRRSLSQGEGIDSQANVDTIAARVVDRLERDHRPRLRSVINATGIILHTNLGRAPLAEQAAQSAYEAARGYLNLELDLDSGKRSSRQLAVRDWLCRLTGAESATVVNNNAAATVIALRALCQGREVVISRGQLIEIGGSFRIPEIMAVSGAILREVGTTNITRLADYEGVLGAQTAALLRVHPSNYRVSGFTQSVPLTDLVALGRKHGIPVIDDIGSGALFDFERFGFHGEPVARASIAAGAHLVLCSGDKLLGGPQAGILAGKKESIEKVEGDPLMRALRCDKMTLAALETTLRLYLNEARALADVPVLAMLGAAPTELRRRAKLLAERLHNIPGLKAVTVREDQAFVGGGSLPDQAMPAWVVEIEAQAIGDADLAHRLRTGTPAVVGRLSEGMLLLDVRTILVRQEDALVAAIEAALKPPATV